MSAINRLIPILFLMPVASYADLNIQDGQYLVTVQSTTYGSGYSLRVYDPSNNSIFASVTNGTATSNVNITAYGYHSKSGLDYTLILNNVTRPVACTVEKADANNPLGMEIKNCTLMGSFTLGKRPYGVQPYVTNTGSWSWNVTATFDAGGTGTFTLTPTSQVTDQYMAESRPDIGTFQATAAQFLMVLY